MKRRKAWWLGITAATLLIAGLLLVVATAPREGFDFLRGQTPIDPQHWRTMKEAYAKHGMHYRMYSFNLRRKAGTELLRLGYKEAPTDWPIDYVFFVKQELGRAAAPALMSSTTPPFEDVVICS